MTKEIKLIVTNIFLIISKPLNSSLFILMFAILFSKVGFSQQKSQLSVRENIGIAPIEKDDSKKQIHSINNKTNNSAIARSYETNTNTENTINNTNQNPFDAVKGKKEDLSKRDFTSKHFTNEDGTYTALIGAGPIHYKKNEEFLDINHQIVTNDNTLYSFTNKTNLFESYFGATSLIGLKNITTEGEVKEFLNTQMYWEVNGQKTNIINAANVPVTINGDKAYYNNIYGNINAEFSVLTGKRKLNYIVPNQQALGTMPSNTDYLVFAEDIKLPNGWTYTVDEKKGILIKDMSGSIIYAYQNPKVLENYQGDSLIPERNNPASFEIKKAGNTLTILLKVKASWLLDENRIFPIAIDPTVNVYPDNSTFWSGWVDDGGFGDDDIMYVGYDGGYETDVFVRFNLSSIPFGSDVTAVTSSLYRNAAYSTGGTNTNRRMIIASCNQDPLTTAFWIDIFNGYSGNISNAVSANNSDGYKVNTFNAAGVTYIENELANGFTTILAYPNGPWGNTNYAGFYGYSSAANRLPYLSITYTDCPPITATASEIVICEGESTTLSASSTGSYTYTWYEDWDYNTQTGTVIGTGASINVTPTQSTAYRVDANCGSYSYDLVTIAVVPPPTVLTPTPTAINICDTNDVIHQLSVTGGTMPNIVLNETFNPSSSIPWITYVTNTTGGNPLDALWYLEDPAAPYYIGWQSNDNSQYAVVDSDYYGNYPMESSLQSPPFSLADYTAPIDLTFYHYFRAQFGGEARVQISTDLGASWANVQTYTTTQGANNNFAFVSLNLNAYAGEPTVLLRFNYTATYDWYWAIDNVTVTGTPIPTTIAWTPTTDLYTDAAATTAYTGQDLNTVYTMPTQGSITYTATSTSSIGCSTDVNIDITGAVAFWNGSIWRNGSEPDLDKNVLITGNYTTNVINGSFSACNLTVNGNLEINDNYFVEVENNTIVSGNITVQSQGAFVQNDDSGTFSLIGTGTSSVNKLTALKQNWYDYTYWSSPVLNQNVNSAFPDAPADRRFYFNAQNYIDSDGDDIDDTNDDWTNASGLQMVSGVGYAATSSSFGPAFPRIDNATFNGAFNTGDVNVNIYTNILNTTNNWNFIGNPYPSAISFYDFYDDNSATIDGVAYLWSQSLPPSDINPGNEGLNFSQNDYAIITAYSGGTAGASMITPTEFIPSAQGFFVNANNSGLVTFKNRTRMADATSNGQFFRTNQYNTPNRLWVNLTTNNGVFNQILVAYVDGATNNFDGYAYDAPRNLSITNVASLATFIDNADNKQFAIQGKDPNSLTLDEVIPLGFNTTIQQATIYKIAIANHEGNFFTNQNIYLKDKLLNQYHNLTDSEYNFTSEIGQFNERFEIVFREQTLSNGNIELNPNNVSIIELNNGNIKFSVNNGLKIQSVQIFDLLGRNLYNLNGQNSTEIYNLSNLSQATYLAKIKLTNGQIITKRTIKKH